LKINKMPAKNITAMFKDVEDKMMKPTWNKTELGKLKVDLLPNITALKGEKEDFIANKLDGLSKDIDVMGGMDAALEAALSHKASSARERRFSAVFEREKKAGQRNLGDQLPDLPVSKTARLPCRHPHRGWPSRLPSRLHDQRYICF